MPRPRISKRVTVLTAKDLGQALGLSAADTAEMEFRSELAIVLAKIIQAGRLTHATLAKGAGSPTADESQEKRSRASGFPPDYPC